MGLIRNLHEENNCLKQEIVRLRWEEEGGKYVRGIGGYDGVGKNQVLGMNKTFSNFTHNVVKGNTQQQQQVQQFNSFR